MGPLSRGTYKLECQHARATHKASDKCLREKRKTINGDDLLWAMSTLGFESYMEPLRLYLQKFRHAEVSRALCHDKQHQQLCRLLLLMTLAAAAAAAATAALLPTKECKAESSWQSCPPEANLCMSSRSSMTCTAPPPPHLALIDWVLPATCWMLPQANSQGVAPAGFMPQSGATSASAGEPSSSS
eukprot:1160488-Pelagomonas_calceolata.AAC.7